MIYLSRRTALSGLAAAATLPWLGRPALAQEAAEVRAQLGWLKTVEFGGYWLADGRGYYGEEGLAPVWLAGGPNIPATPPIVAGGQADLGIGEQLLSVADAVAAGTDLVAFGAVFQESPSGIVSLAEAPITKAEDIIGKRIGLQSGAKPFVDALLQINGLEPDYEEVPVGFDPTPLVEGACDGMVCFVTNQPIVLKLQGIPYVTATYASMGMPAYAGVLYAGRAYLDGNRDRVVGFLRASRRGWTDYMADPAAAVTLAVETYGADLGLDPAQQVEQAAAQAPLIAGDGSQPLLALSRELVEGPIMEGFRLTGRTDLPPVESWIDFSISDEAG